MVSGYAAAATALLALSGVNSFGKFIYSSVGCISVHLQGCCIFCDGYGNSASSRVDIIIFTTTRNTQRSDCVVCNNFILGGGHCNELFHMHLVPNIRNETKGDQQN